MLVVIKVATSTITRISKEYHQLQIERQIKSEKWLMPHIKPGCPVDYGCGRILFARENAGFLNPMGEGISAGIESGYCLAQAISDNCDDIDGVYAKYQFLTAALKVYIQRQWDFVARMSSTFSHMKL